MARFGNLHSNMERLYGNIYKWVHTFYKIYIPIWKDYTEYGVERDKIADEIYIPIWKDYTSSIT